MHIHEHKTVHIHQAKRDVQIKYDLKVEGKRFAVAQGQLPAVAGASLGLFLRAGTGALVQGYSPSVKESDETKYTLQNVGGRMLEETSSVLVPKVCTPTHARY